jgi:hypothetical protein
MTFLSARLGSARVVVLLFLTALAVAPSFAAGQGGTGPASIIGQVTDESGAVLPGVTVIATSPALQVPQMTAVTNEQGEYRIIPLPVGVYALEYTLPGFQTRRVEDVRLAIGFVAKLDQVMNVGALSETVTVSGVSPLVDTTSAATRTTLTGEALMLLPSAHAGISGLLQQVPGVRSNLDVGGSSAAATATFVFNGQTGQVWQLMEGVLSGRQNGLGNGTHYDFTIVDQVRIQTVGNAAEMPKRGMMVDIISKSGGNDFHGMGTGSTTHDSLQSDNVDAKQRAQGVEGTPRLDRRWDVSGQLGGKLIENKLWFFSGLRHRQTDVEILNSTNPDGSPAIHLQDQHYMSHKLSAQITPSNKFIGFYHWTSGQEKGGNGGEFVPPESHNNQTETYRIVKGELQMVRGNRFVLSAQAGVYRAKSFGEGFAPGKPATIDIVTLKQTGMSLSDTAMSRFQLHHNRGVATLFQPNLFLGNHEFKIGFDNTFDYSIMERGDRRAEGDYRLRFSNGAALEIEVLNSPVKSTTRGFYAGVYAQDAWTIGRRLTLNLGFRAAHDKPQVPEQCQIGGQFSEAFPVECFPKVELNVWNSFAPRIHGVYDLSGDGRTVIKGGWGVFKKRREVQSYEVLLLNSNANRTSTYRWRDLNGNRDYNPGEVNLDPNGPDFISFGSLTAGVFNPNELQPREDEFTLAFEKQLVGNVAIRVSSVYAHNKNVPRILNPLLPYGVYTIPITNRDPGADGVLGNADDTGNSITYYDFPAALRGARFQTAQLVNDDPRNDTKYGTIEFAATRRLANNWQISGSYSRTKKNIPFGDASANALALNPNAEIYVADNTWEWIGKISGSYVFPKGILGSVNYDVRSGQALARQVLFRGGTSIPSIALNVEPIGSIMLPAPKLLDLRGSKQFRLGNGRLLELYVDCFNVLNFNGATGVTVRAGPSFMVPTTIVDPRIMQIGGQFTF